MSRLGAFMIVIAYPILVFGQGNGVASPALGLGIGLGVPGNPLVQSYQPTVPSPSTTLNGGTGTGWGSGGAAQTAAGAALQGTAQLISAAGQYNLASSAAAVNASHAESNEMRNRVQGVKTYWEMRDLGSFERASERGPHATPEEFASRARAAAPRALTASQMDPASGVLYWPVALQDGSFKAQRIVLDEYAAKWAKYGALDYGEKVQVRENIGSMYAALRSQIAAILPQDYVESRAFLESLLYATTRAIL